VHGQLTLGRQAIAGAQRTALDARANVAHDLVGTAFAAPSIAVSVVLRRNHEGAQL
jgi:hypothetical protein